MILAPRLRRAALTAHVAASVGWLGALLAFLTHAAVGVATDDAFGARAAAVGMGVTAWFAVLPLSIASVVTGVIQALGSAWGLFRHYWLIAKMLLTAVATGVLLLKMAPIDNLAAAAASSPLSSADHALRVSLLIHAVGGVVLLLVILGLAIFKPAGRTRFGRHDEAPEPLPGWVKGAAILLLLMILAVGMMISFGGHGPSMHGL